MRALGYACLISLTAFGCTGIVSTSSSSNGSGSSTGAGTSTNPPLTGGAVGGSGSTTVGDNSNPGAGTGNGSGTTTTAGGAGQVATTCSPLSPVTRRVWRLSTEQYQSAVGDLLQLTTPLQLTNRGGEAQWAFFSDASLQVTNDFQYAMYQAIESALPNVPASLTACNSGEAPTACATRIAQTFGAKAFRRPLTTAEVSALVSNPAQPASGSNAAVSAAPFLQAGADTQTGIKSIIEAILLSPSFVYRTELGPTDLAADGSGNYPSTKLTPYEVATQLGFTLLGSTPDAALETAAADTSDNGLGSANGIALQVKRLLALPQVKANLTNIVAGWFNIGQLFLKQHDTQFLTAASAADQVDQSGIEADLYSSAQQFITNTLWTNSGKVTDLLSSQTFYVNTRLASLYPGLTYPSGAPTSLTAFVPATFADTEQRVGLLTYPSYFWAQSDPAVNSIVKRGKAIHDDVICADPLPSPPDLTTAAALAVIGTGDSEITHSDARMKTAPCNGCHTQMDPYARILQHFGPIGNYRVMDEMGRAIDTNQPFINGPLAPQTISDPKALADGLIATGHISGCAVQKMSSYLIGSMIDTYDTCEIQTVRDAFNKTDGSLASLFGTVLAADFGRARTGGTK